MTKSTAATTCVQDQDQDDDRVNMYTVGGTALSKTSRRRRLIRELVLDYGFSTCVVEHAGLLLTMQDLPSCVCAAHSMSPP
jgi:hypothetical protein